MEKVPTNEGSDEDKEGEVIDVREEDDEAIDLTEVEEVKEEEEATNPEETPEYWDELWKKAIRSSEEMELLVRRSIELSNRQYENQTLDEQRKKGKTIEEDDTSAIDFDVNTEENKEEWIEEIRKASNTASKKRVRSKMPPELSLRASVRPFTYRNVVKEIVLMRHAIIDGDVIVSC